MSGEEILLIAMFVAAAYSDVEIFFHYDLVDVCVHTAISPQVGSIQDNWHFHQTTKFMNVFARRNNRSAI